MKKLLSICLAFLVMLSVIPFSVTADAQTGIDLTTYVNSVNSESNTITVGVKVENNSGIRALWITLAYDANQATLKEVEKKALYDSDVSDVGACSPDTKNPFEISWAYVTNENSTYTGDIALLTFELKEKITCTTTFNVDLGVKEAWDANKDAVLSTAADGAFANLVGHAYNEVVTEPTCTDKGFTTHTCANCGDSYVDNYADALGHSYEIVVTKPTCTDKGYTTYTCACGDSYVDNEVEATGHSFGDWVIDSDATCEADGSKSRECDCGETETEVIPAIGHAYNEVVTNPTCTDKGFTTHTCANCGDSYVDNEVEATGHNYESVVTEPTATEAGYTTHTCANCGDSYVDSYITVTVGDVNNDGSINLKDLVALSQYVAMWEVEYYKAAMDIDGSGEVDLEDVTLFSEYLAGWNVETLI